MKNNNILFNYSRLSISAVLIFTLLSCSDESDKIKKEVEITIAAEMSLLPATLWVAENQGFFKKQNIKLNIIEFDSGRNALEAMLKDASINISTVAQTPVVFNSFNNEQYVIFATMAYSVDDIKVLARKDHGIEKPSDLKGKKVGATKRSTGHYFLEGFLNHYDFTLNDVELVDINAAKLKGKLESGSLDAITSWEPHISNAEKSIGKDKLSLFISPTPFRKDFYFTTQKKYAEKNRDILQRFLAATIEAEEYINNNKHNSQVIVANRLNVPIKMIQKIWDNFTFEITLEQSILVNLENEAFWAKGLSPKYKRVPNYLDFIDVNPLSKVKPHGVNLIF